MDEKELNHLVNLLKHSTKVEFHIPSLFYDKVVSENIKRKQKEINEAYDYLSKSDEYILLIQYGLDSDEIKIKVHKGK